MDLVELSYNVKKGYGVVLETLFFSILPSTEKRLGALMLSP